MATRACELGRIECNQQSVKPSREVHAGDMLRIQNDSGKFEVRILALSAMRGPAAVAQTLYEETESSKAERAALAEQRRLMPDGELFREGRPSKQDRRKLSRLRGRF